MIDGCSKKSMFSKILMGDPSDNIRGVLSKTKTAQLMNCCKDDNAMDDIVKGLNIRQQKTFEFNTKMINFDHIPSEIKNNIIKTYHNHTFINSDLCFCKLYKQS